MITYDYHEDNCPLPDQLRKMHISLHRETLPVADYIPSGIHGQKVAIERKDSADYVSSLKDGSLHTQLCELSTNYDYAILLVEGLVTQELVYRKIKRSSILSSLAGCILKRSPDGKQGTISMVNVENVWDSALFIKYVHDKLHDENGLIRSPVTRVHKYAEDDRVVVLGSCPQIGMTLAKNILRQPRTNTIQKVFNASPDEIAEADGVGKVYSKMIYDLARQEYKEVL